MQDRSHILTEQRLSESANLDAMSALDVVHVMNEQDRVAVEAVAAVRAEVAKAADAIAERLRRGGRLIYFGAGTSGRLGVLDASECPPTFRADPRQVQGVIAGGEAAMFVAQEGAEDSPRQGADAVDEKQVGADDVICGIAAGGTTPFVHGALRRGRELGAFTVFVACVPNTGDEPEVDVQIRPLTGPEVLTGSTRLKAGTATKLVLNQLTTTAMVLLGKCYGNLMVDLKASNEKLVDRGARIITEITGVDRATALDLLERADGHVKKAVVMQRLGVDADEAVAKLDAAGGRLREALGE
ncbi:MAG: N-acetylmuramic acid 6-phosphate etherase [Planctomycetota bacterium]